MTRFTRLACVGALAGTVAALVPLSAAPAAAASVPEVIAEGLNNPYKMSFGPDGSLFIAESGVGDQIGDGPCIAEEGTGGTCVGLTGSVTKVDTESGAQERVITGLPSFAAGFTNGSGAVGPVDVAVGPDGTMHVLIGSAGPLSWRDELGPHGARLGTLLEVTPTGEVSIFADLAAFERTNNPDGRQPGPVTTDSNPSSIEVNPGGGFWATDSGGNDVLTIAGDGAITLEALLPFGEADDPRFAGTTTIEYEPLPSSITNGAAGLLVTESTGYPNPVGASDIYELDPDSGELVVSERGFTSVIDAAQGPDGSMYVLELASEGLRAVEENGPPFRPASRLTQIRTDGSRKVLLQNELFRPEAATDGPAGVPGGVAVGPDGMIYVSSGTSNSAGQGYVLKVDPTVARDPATEAACDPVAVPGAGFADTGVNVHREAIDCLNWWGIIKGKTPTTFQPLAKIRRDQVASVVGRLLEAAAVTLPADPPDAFSDDDGNVHEGYINALAALGVVGGTKAGTYDPESFVGRGQIASLLARACTVVSGAEVASGPDVFRDDDRSVHQLAINAVAAAGWVKGVNSTTFAPNDDAAPRTTRINGRPHA